MVPRPDAVTVSHSNDRQTAQAGRGGWRSVPQLEQRWMRSLCAFAPSKKNRFSWVRAGRGRFGRGWLVSGVDEALGSAEAGAAGRGRNLRIRNRIVATGSP